MADELPSDMVPQFEPPADVQNVTLKLPSEKASPADDGTAQGGTRRPSTGAAPDLAEADDAPSTGNSEPA